MQPSHLNKRCCTITQHLHGQCSFYHPRKNELQGDAFTLNTHSSKKASILSRTNGTNIWTTMEIVWQQCFTKS